MPPVEFADVEAMAVAFADERTVEHVGTRVPSPRPARYVRIFRTGGAALNRALDLAQITVTSSAESSVAAVALGGAMRHAFLNEYTAMPLVRSVEEVSGLYFDPDPDTGEDRYTFTIRMSVRAAR